MFAEHAFRSTARNVWVVKKPHNQNCFAVGHGSSRPAVLSFVEKRHAMVFIKMDKQMKDPGEVLRRPYDKVVIESMPLDYLEKSCAAGGLDLCVVMRDGHTERLDLAPACMDHMVFNLENSFRYYSS